MTAVERRDLSLALRRGASVTTCGWPARSTALVICDVWDKHWCASASARVEELAPAVNSLAEAARAKGVFIVHAPSNVIEAPLYAGGGAAERARAALRATPPVPLTSYERFGTSWCYRAPDHEPPLPIDDSDQCDCEPKCANVNGQVWTRQHPAIRIDDTANALTDDGATLYNLLASRSIRHVLICGVHLNFCVLGRGFGVRQLLAMGMEVALVRDLTDSIFNSCAQQPVVGHHAGTAMLVAHVEEHLCPTVESSQVTEAGGAFRFSDCDTPV